MSALTIASSRSDRAGATSLVGRLRGSLVAKVSLLIGAMGACLAIAFAALGSMLIGDYELERHLKRIEELVTTIESTAQVACFTGEAALATEVAKGLMKNASVAAARITCDQETLAELRKPGTAAHETRRVAKAIFSPFDAGSPVGEITLEADTSVIVAEADAYSSLLSQFLLLEALAVTIVVSLLILRVVVRPITRFAEQLQQFEGRVDVRLVPPPGHRANELGHLATAFNRMIDSLGILLGKERAMSEKVARSEQRFRALAENSPDIILRYDAELALIFANPAYVRELAAARGHPESGHLDEADVWLPAMPREEFDARLGQVISSGEPDRMLWEWQSAVGQAICHEMYVVAEYDGGRQIVGALVLGRNISERKEIERQLVHQATHDVLTGLANRALLKDRVQHAIARSRRDGSALAVAFIDLDHFKDINDSFGHDVGDELLKVVAGRLLSTLRESDTVARPGGDEFVVLLGGATGQQNVNAVVQKIRRAIDQPCQIGQHQIFPRASIGVAVYPEDGGDADDLLRNADTAMYAAKRDGRNRCRLFSPSMNEELNEWMKLTSDLHRAIEHGEFSLHYQPKVRLDTGELVGMEALIRWHHPELGLVSPARFIPAAEKSGLIVPIGQWVLDEACRQLKSWHAEGLAPGPVAVNLSAAQCQGTQLPWQVRRTLDRYALSAKHLEVEITESIVMADTEESVCAFWILRDSGVQISVDDFGTGYSSLSYLKRLPVDKVKIDKSFVDDIETGPNSTAIIRAIVAMAHSLNLEVVAEGVETCAQAEFLRRAGCDQLQGYHFSRPLPADEMAAVLRTGKRLVWPATT